VSEASWPDTHTCFMEGIKEIGGPSWYSRKNNVCRGKGEGVIEEEITGSYLFDAET